MAAAIRQLHARRGGALVEFVIIFPVLMILVFGVWEFGRIFDAWLVSTNAAREGARYAVEWTENQGEFTTFVKSKVLNYVQSGYGSTRLGAGDVHIDASDIDVEYPEDGQVRVVVRANVDIWAPAVPPLTYEDDHVFTVTAWSTMRQ